MATLLSGKEVAATLAEQTAREAESLRKQGVLPTLAIVRVGERGDDLAYERGAVKRCEGAGVAVRSFALPSDCAQQDVIDALRQVNADETIHGCLLLRPLPKTMDDRAVCNTLAPEKDVDGVTDASMAGVYAGAALGFPPCTPAACMAVLAHFGIDCTGKSAVVVGRSLVVGKPAAMMLLRKNATVTLCHTKTADMPAVCRGADVLVVSAGRAGLVTGDYIKPGAVVLDVGVNVGADGKLCGDVDFASAEPMAGAITPVPGGIGAVTTAILVKHTVDAAKKATQK